jgi:putative transposase
MEKFQGKYRISSARLQNWDYASSGMYFVTLCTKNSEHYFGQIIKPENEKEHSVVKLSEIGNIVETEWLKTPEMRSDMNLKLDEYQVMPNHFHAILIIGENEFNNKESNDESSENPAGRDAMTRVSIVADSGSNAKPDLVFEMESQMILETNMIHKNKFAPQSKNLASIMRGFKSAITMYALNNNIVFGWQARFYDHIIRDFDEYQRIAQYIRNNPDNWKNDTLH